MRGVDEIERRHKRQVGILTVRCGAARVVFDEPTIAAVRRAIDSALCDDPGDITAEPSQRHGASRVTRQRDPLPCSAAVLRGHEQCRDAVVADIALLREHPRAQGVLRCEAGDATSYAPTRDGSPRLAAVVGRDDPGLAVAGLLGRYVTPAEPTIFFFGELQELRSDVASVLLSPC